MTTLDDASSRQLERQPDSNTSVDDLKLKATEAGIKPSRINAYVNLGQATTTLQTALAQRQQTFTSEDIRGFQDYLNSNIASDWLVGKGALDPEVVLSIYSDYQSQQFKQRINAEGQVVRSSDKREAQLHSLLEKRETQKAERKEFLGGVEENKADITERFNRYDEMTERDLKTFEEREKDADDDLFESATWRNSISLNIRKLVGVLKSLTSVFKAKETTEIKPTDEEKRQRRKEKYMENYVMPDVYATVTAALPYSPKPGTADSEQDAA